MVIWAENKGMQADFEKLRTEADKRMAAFCFAEAAGLYRAAAENLRECIQAMEDSGNKGAAEKWKRLMAECLYAELKAHYGVRTVNSFFDGHGTEVYFALPGMKRRDSGEAESRDGECGILTEEGESPFVPMTESTRYRRLIAHCHDSGIPTDEYRRGAVRMETAQEEIAAALAATTKEGYLWDVFVCAKISRATEASPSLSGNIPELGKILRVVRSLRKRGLRVFFSRENMSGGIDNDKKILGAMLRSRCMLVIGTCPRRGDAYAHLNSRWVKSEWLRWLYYRQNGRKSAVGEEDSFFFYCPDKSCPIPDKMRAFGVQAMYDFRQTADALVRASSDYAGEIRMRERIERHFLEKGADEALREDLRLMRDAGESARNKDPERALLSALLQLRYDTGNYGQSKRQICRSCKSGVVIKNAAAAEELRSRLCRIEELRKQKRKLTARKGSPLGEEYRASLRYAERLRPRRGGAVTAAAVMLLLGGAFYLSQSRLQYTLQGDGKGYTVSDGLFWREETLYIPAEYNGLPVTAVAADAFSGEGTLLSVGGGDSLKTIGEGAFAGCDSLRTAQLCAGLVYVGEGAFADCPMLSFSLYSDGSLTREGCENLLSSNSCLSVRYPVTLAEEERVLYVPGGENYVLEVPRKQGYDFIGWRDEKGRYYTDGEGRCLLSVTGALTLYADFSPAENRLHLYNGDTRQTLTLRTDEQMTPGIPEREGYVFLGYSHTPEGAVAVAPGEAYTVGTEAEQSLYAVWRAGENVCTVLTFLQSADGSYSDTPDKTHTVSCLTGAYVTPAVETYEGYLSPHGVGITVAADGSSTVCYYYQREKHTVFVEASCEGCEDAAHLSALGGGEYRLGQQVSLRASTDTAEKGAFYWYLDGELLCEGDEITLTVERDTALQVIFVPAVAAEDSVEADVTDGEEKEM